MDNNQKRQLDKLIQENNVQDNTNQIRNEKKSYKIRESVKYIESVKQKLHNTRDFRQLDKECMKGGSYLFMNFPNIYNKLLKYQIDVNILNKFLDELENIESGKQTQHEASFRVGNLLKQMYIDTKLESPQEETKQKKESPQSKKISYAEFKKMN